MENKELRKTLFKPISLHELLKGTEFEHCVPKPRQSAVPQGSDLMLKEKKMLQPMRMCELIKDDPVLAKLIKEQEMQKNKPKILINNATVEQLSPDYEDIHVKPKKVDVGIRRNLFNHKPQPKVSFSTKKKSPVLFTKTNLPKFVKKSKENIKELANKRMNNGPVYNVPHLKRIANKSSVQNGVSKETAILKKIEVLMDEENQLHKNFVEKRQEIRCKIDKLFRELKSAHNSKTLVTKQKTLSDNCVTKRKGMPEDGTPLLDMENEEKLQFCIVKKLNISSNSSGTLQFEELEKEFASDKENDPQCDTNIVTSKTVVITPKSVLKTSNKQVSDTQSQTAGKSVTFMSPVMDKSQKAMTIYNSFRNDCTMLCTPKLSANFDSPSNAKCFKQQLSRAVQKQCLMLVETPLK